MTSKSFDWMVIGAGPAGIAAVGKLIDSGVSAKSIGWMDPYFQVGDLGRKWYKVSSNTEVDLFLKFLLDCEAFRYNERPKSFPIDKLPPKDTCQLQNIAEPLQWVTDHLIKKVNPIEDKALSLSLKDNRWEIKAENSKCFAKNVILANGCAEKRLTYPDIEEIPIDVALNPEKLQKAFNPDDTIGVFGASHSAVIVLQNLEKLKAKNIINFYRAPHVYAVQLDTWTLFDNTGLKGAAAIWAKKNLDGELPKSIKRTLTSDQSYEKDLSVCNKAVYAIGFERHQAPVLEQFEKITYNDKTGIIAPGLFGFGIAFPQAQYDPLMNLEHRVGLWKFMDYLNTILPIWFQYANQDFSKEVKKK
ncbi:MAG: hypothetical protein S4CHLAM20_15230 [Chlamydiia bacterium]|nr:hypothetical protein [Chlamydiia bacterium]